MDFETELSIDKNALDKEWLKQPVIYFHYAKESEKANDVYQRAKDNLEVVRADADKDERRRLDQQGEKITEKSVEAAVLRNKDYQNAVDELAKAKHEAGILQAAVKAFDHKKTALENLVRLYLGGYFSSPTEPREKKTTFKEDSFDDEQVSKLNNKRRRG